MGGEESPCHTLPCPNRLSPCPPPLPDLGYSHPLRRARRRLLPLMHLVGQRRCTNPREQGGAGHLLSRDSQQLFQPTSLWNFDHFKVIRSFPSSLLALDSKGISTLLHGRKTRMAAGFALRAICGRLQGREARISPYPGTNGQFQSYFLAARMLMMLEHLTM